MAGKSQNSIARKAYSIATNLDTRLWKSNERKTKAIQDIFYKLLRDKYQDKAKPLGFVLLKGDILRKLRAALKIGR